MKHNFIAFIVLVQIFLIFLKPKTLRKTYGYLQELQRCNAKLDEICALPDSDPKKMDEDRRYSRLYYQISTDIGNSFIAPAIFD